MGKWLLAIMMHALLNGSILTVWALLLHLKVNGTAEIVFKNNYCFIIMVGVVTIVSQSLFRSSFYHRNIVLHRILFFTGVAATFKVILFIK